MKAVDEWDVAYAEVGGIQLLARMYCDKLLRTDSTRTEARLPGIVMVHGGAWTANDRTTPEVLNRFLASKGLFVCSLDFRCGPDFQHPAASADICAGIRFVRRNADQFDVDPDRIGLIGSSSGGHLALCCALQPDVDAHRTTEHIRCEQTRDDGAEVSAGVNYVIALWPVSDPFMRYIHAVDTKRDELIRAHHGYFDSVIHMREASIQKVLQAEQFTQRPSVMIVQPGLDANIPRPMTLDLIDSLQGADFELDYRFMPGLPHAFAYEASDATDQVANYIWDFIRRRLG